MSKITFRRYTVALIETVIGLIILLALTIGIAVIMGWGLQILGVA